jgi:hypothetical protein
MAGIYAWQLRLGQVGWLNRGREGSSWYLYFTSSSRTIQMSQKSSSKSKLKFFKTLKLLEISKVCLIRKSYKYLKVLH